MALGKLFIIKKKREREVRRGKKKDVERQGGTMGREKGREKE